jgi:hypothetical protein
MASLLLFLPRLFQFFGVFRNFVGFVQPMWPFVRQFFGRRPAVA